MTDSQSPVHQDSSLSAGRVLFAVVIVAMLAAIVWGFTQFRSQKKQSDDALAKVLSENEALQKQMANLKATVGDIKTADLYQQEEQTLAKDEITVVQQRTGRAQSELLTLAQLQQRWTSAFDTLKDDEVGRRIAADPALVDLLATILAGAPKPNIVDDLQSRLQPMADQLDESLSADIISFKPTAAFIDRVEQIEKELATASLWYQDHLHELDALGEKAAAISPANRSLREALANREAERAQERVARLAAENQRTQEMIDQTIGKAKREADLKIAEAEAEAKRLVGDSTAARIMQEAQAEKAKQEDAMRKKLESEQLAQLKRDFQRDLPDIRLHLQPFITDGYTYNGDSGRAGPVSLAALTAFGALRDGRPGLEKLLYAGGTSTNDRDRGGFPQYGGGEWGWQQVDKEYITKAQDYLKKYGQLMVEEGLLAQ